MSVISPTLEVTYTTITWGIASSVLMMAIDSTMALVGRIICLSSMKVLPGIAPQLGIDSKLPSTFFKAPTTVSTAADPGHAQSTDPSEVAIPISTPLVPDVSEVDTLEHVPNAEDDPLDDPDMELELSSAKQGIESLTVTDLKEITRFLPSDL